jgi:hypothetical protein
MRGMMAELSGAFQMLNSISTPALIIKETFDVYCPAQARRKSSTGDHRERREIFIIHFSALSAPSCVNLTY